MDKKEYIELLKASLTPLQLIIMELHLNQLINELLEQIENKLPENPYPKWLFPMSTKDYVKAIPDNKLRTAISGCIGRWVWNNCIEMTKEAIINSKE